jgi:hypothetical protein
VSDLKLQFIILPKQTFVVYSQIEIAVYFFLDGIHPSVQPIGRTEQGALLEVVVVEQQVQRHGLHQNEKQDGAVFCKEPQDISHRALINFRESITTGYQVKKIEMSVKVKALDRSGPGAYLRYVRSHFCSATQRLTFISIF